MKLFNQQSKKIFLIVLCSIHLSAHDHKTVSCNSAVSYALDYVCRFGDQLYNYIRAYHVAWKYKLLFYYKPFAFSDQLALSTIHPHLSQEIRQQFLKIYDFDEHSYQDEQRMKEMLECLNNKQNDTLYLIPFYFPTEWYWEEEEFHVQLGELIKPLHPLKLTPIPSNMITVAVHVRSVNNTFDQKERIELMPSKFPPYSFYINGIKEITQIFKDKPLYVYIFTDDPQPTSIKDLFNDALKDKLHLTFACRETNNSRDLNVLEDFFSMMQFDCLICPSSSYSLCAMAVSAPLVEITTPGWNVYSKDSKGNILIDNSVKIRTQKRKKVIKRYTVKAE